MRSSSSVAPWLLVAALIPCMWLHCTTALARCEPYRGYPEMCSLFFESVVQANSSRYSVYIPSGLDQADLVDIFDSSFPWQVRVLPGECRKAISFWFCATIFRRCHDVPIASLIADADVNAALTVAVPSFTCDILCERIQGNGSSCEDVSRVQSALAALTCGFTPGPYESVLADITQLLNTTTHSSSSSNNSTLDVQAAALEEAVGCVGAEALPKHHPIYCGKWLVWSEVRDHCYVGCSAPLFFTFGQRQAAFLGHFIGSIINLALGVFAVIPFLVPHRRRRFPHHLPAAFMCASMLISLSLMVRYSMNVDEHACLDKERSRNGEFTAYGVATGVIHHLGYHLLLCYWQATSLHLLIVGSLHSTFPTVVEIFESIPCMIVTHLYPLVLFSIYYALLHEVTYGMMPNGMVMIDGFIEDQFLMSNIWYTVLVGIGAVSSFAVCVFVVLHNWRLFGSLKESTKHLRDYWRVFVFTMWVMVSLSIPLSLMWYWYDHTDTIINGLANYYSCGMERRDGDVGHCDADWDEDGLFVFMFIAFFIFSTVGLCFSVTYGTSRRSLLFWSDFLRGRFSAAIHESTFRSGSGGSSAGRSSGGRSGDGR
mmetsp:Transcript_33471/g.84022  ORF Transcript_33471/g.84022 Transcript_33471/m.84022 type:complete len:597 (-) Transcript_33471:97-1887(-)